MTRRTATPRDDHLPPGLVAGGIAFEVLSATASEEATPPEWIKLTPRGRVTARDGRVFVFDPERLVAAYVADGLALPVDFDHETEFGFTLGARPARGWIAALEARADGLYGRVDWLPEAVAAIRARAYRYVSPTFWRDEDGVTARLLKGAALVTSPALSMPALASATHPEDDPMLKELLAELGLPDAATLAEARSAIARLSAVDPARYVPKDQHDATQAALAQAQAAIRAAEEAAEAARCATLVDEAIKAGKIAPAARDHYVALARAAFDATRGAIEAMPVVLTAGEAAAASGDAAAGGAGRLSEDERRIVTSLGLTEAAYLAARSA